MKPRRTAEANSVYSLPGGNEDNDLWLHSTFEETTGDPTMVSTWELSAQERARVAAGERICLVVFGMAHPPVAVELEGEFYDYRRKPSGCAACDEGVERRQVWGSDPPAYTHHYGGEPGTVAPCSLEELST